ncbi:MAG: sulfite exporter TauE/SafE family protein [Kiritimatiellae bacterium]|nr:sulfite exporter TauE/SafE family protein [Kiritimatiellia bacterium]
MRRRIRNLIFWGATIAVIPVAGMASDVSHHGVLRAGHSWWVWSLALFAVTLFTGIVAPLAGLGGGVLFVPVVSSFFPFHMDFVRATGLLVALCGSLAASPRLLKANLASLRLALPFAVVSSICSIVGAMLGLVLPERSIQTAMGLVLLGIVAVMLSVAKGREEPKVTRPDRLALMFGIDGTYIESATGREVEWRVHRTPIGLLLFCFIGFLAGMFGLGAGWANVPVLHLMMGVPLKVSVATSTVLLSITDTSAAWIYMHHGCVIPLVVVPSVAGIMLGSRIGVLLLRRTEPRHIRWVVVALLGFCGLKAFTKGLGLPFLF